MASGLRGEPMQRYIFSGPICSHAHVAHGRYSRASQLKVVRERVGCISAIWSLTV